MDEEREIECGKSGHKPRRPSRARALLGTRICTALICTALGCAQSANAPPAARADATATSAPPSCDPARDREAILDMAGAFRVQFSFREVEALRPGYQLAAPYDAQGTEVVFAVEDDERHIVLQHVLLVRGEGGELEAMKHWRQDWAFEDGQLLEFRGERSWQQRALAENEVRCTWSQAVFQVDDGPRYESYGRWVHAADRSTWTSAETWRPLPRREEKRAAEYDVLLGVNRLVVTRGGWDHEQDNRKWQLAEGSALAREQGLNRYVRTDLGDSAEVASRYLAETGAFWRDVRSVWAELLRDRMLVHVRDAVDGEPLYAQLFPLAEASADEAPAQRREHIRALISPFVQEPSLASRAPAAAPPP